VRARQQWDHRVPDGRRDCSITEQKQRGRARLAVLHDVHITIVKPNEPAVSARIAGHVLCHCAISCHLP
jgi:hypothetical protein